MPMAKTLVIEPAACSLSSVLVVSRSYSLVVTPVLVALVRPMMARIPPASYQSSRLHVLGSRRSAVHSM